MLSLLCLIAYFYAFISLQPPTKHWVAAVSASVILVIDVLRLIALPQPLVSFGIGAGGLCVMIVATVVARKFNLSPFMAAIGSLLVGMVAVYGMGALYGVSGMEGFAVLLWGMITAYHVRVLSNS